MYYRLVFGIVAALYCGLVQAEIRQVEFRSKSQQVLKIEVLNDQTFHFMYSFDPKADAKFEVSPYIAQIPSEKNHTEYQAAYQGPGVYKANGNRVSTQKFQIEVDQATLCLSIASSEAGCKQIQLTKICPLWQEKKVKGLTLERGPIENLYGLGEQFLPQRYGNTDGDWMGQVRSPGRFGNEMVNYPPNSGAGGAVGNTQFPILYAMTAGALGYSFFLDNIYEQRWDFSAEASRGPWRVEANPLQLRGFITVAGGLPELRRAYMDLVGHPLVPPKKAFGLWVSQYGFDGWTEIEEKLKTLREKHFPIDGFVLDLQWFGGIRENSELTHMGTLDFDTSKAHFPDPATKIRSFREKQGIGFIAIEESYIGKGLKEFADLANRGFLVKAPAADQTPLYINENPWWGLGGMIDWSVPGAGAYWHRTKRQNLIDLGILGHWTDLGEPEMYQHVEIVDGNKVYTIPDNEAETHNIFSLDWHESIFKGYQASGSKQRPFILSRSGGSGMQRYGAAMWSGDIGTRLENVATHYNVQMEMSLSGQDYFGADIGGFHREDLNSDLNDLYTQWFADACAFDVPIRPHTENLAKSRETAPDRVGDWASNLENLRTRYELSPYYYSLAHLAHLKAEPVVPPVFFYYPSSTDRVLGSEKLIGRNLLVAVVAKAAEKTRSIYLPPGDWIDNQTLSWYHAPLGGHVIDLYPLYHDGRLRLPVFARAGAIIPLMKVDDQTMNILGKRTDGVTHNELRFRVFASPSASEFTVFEDDGATIAYLSGSLSQTTISQKQSGGEVTVTVAPTIGHYSYEDPNSGVVTESPSSRQFEVELAIEELRDTSRVQVKLDGELLQRFDSQKKYDSASSGYLVMDHLIYAKSALLSVQKNKVFEFLTAHEN